MKNKVDVAIIGSGFAGSILAMILAKSGLRIALIDSMPHPRFAIGESSTPLADMILRRLARLHQLPSLEALSTWGTWQKNHPRLTCGRKRGFSYYRHQRGHVFSEHQLGEQSLLVAASANDDVADTHWYRQEVDSFLFQESLNLGVLEFIGHRIVAVDRSAEGSYTLHSIHASGESTIRSDWVIDASGAAGVSAKIMNQPDLTHKLQTKTRSTYAHYKGIGSWTQQLCKLGQDIQQNPFDADDAAQHHLTETGWLWMLRFNNGITSVGLTEWIGEMPTWPENSSHHLNQCAPRTNESQSLPRLVEDYPSLTEMTATASFVGPPNGVQSTGRLQRFFNPLLSPRYLMLPTAALTLDPLHSTGIAHALAGVERILDIILVRSQGKEQMLAMQQYETSFLQESRILDELVNTAYLTMGDFERFTAACMLYFAGAIACEERYQQGEVPSHLWNTDDPAFTNFVTRACAALRDHQEDYQDMISDGLLPWNTAGLMDPGVQNRYAYTATK